MPEIKTVNPSISSASDVSNFRNPGLDDISGTNQPFPPSGDGIGTGLGGSDNAIHFNPNAIVLTPKMSIRGGVAGSSPFAAGPIVQGHLATADGSDSLSFPQGSLVIPGFRQNFDFNQGSIPFWYTPEVDSATANRGDVFYGPIHVIVSLNKLSIFSNGVSLLVIDPANFVAGTTYHIVISWDTKYPIDNAGNFVRVSINDVHTYGRTTTFVPVEFANLYIGSQVISFPSNAVIKGFTVYRRVLFDGTFGVDAQNGDEIALMYNAGAGTDPAAITGPWDICFCLPTNCDTANPIVTGPGHAWSFPFGTNVLQNWYLNGVTNWTDEGTPKNLVSVGFNGTNTAINGGNQASVNNLADNTLTVEAWVLSVKNGNMKALITKNEGGLRGWTFYINPNGTLRATVFCATTNADVSTPFGIDDGHFHHIAFSFNDAGDRKVRIWVDGNLSATSAAASGLIIVDAAYMLGIGVAGSVVNNLGNQGWVRISNSDRYGTVNFVPNARNNPPANDASTVRLFKVDEGVGTTITDYSTNAQNATLSNGVWNVTREMAIDSPGARVYTGGLMISADANNEGMKQVVAAAAGSDYAVRALVYSEDMIGQPKIIIRDETNGADITTVSAFGAFDNLVVNGTFDADADWTKGTGWTIAAGKATHAAGSASLLQTVNTAVVKVGYTYVVTYTISGRTAGSVTIRVSDVGLGTARSSNATFTENILVPSTANLSIYFSADATFDGSIDNVTVMQIPDESHPEALIFSFELPTIARGAVADCISFSVKLVSAVPGVVGFNGIEVVPQLLDNPSLDKGAGNPFIPYGWSNTGGLLAGESVTDTADAIGAASVSFPVAVNHYFSQTLTPTIGRFYGCGFALKSIDGGQARGIFGSQARWALHSVATTPIFDVNTTSRIWGRRYAVVRPVISSDAVLFGYGTGTEKLDNAYMIPLDDVSLTVTPATLANSIENIIGLRIDGSDLAPQNISAGLSTTLFFSLKFGLEPRHRIGVSDRYSSTLPTFVYVFYNADPANNRIFFNRSGASIMVRFYSAGVLVTLSVAEGTLLQNKSIVEITYSFPNLILKINGVVVGTAVIASPLAGAFDSPIYWGGYFGNGDAVFYPA